MKNSGKNGAIAQNDGTYGSPTWNTLTGTRDQKLSLEWDKFEAGDRESNWKSYLLSQKDAAVEFDMIWNSTNTDHTGLRTACLAGTPKEYAIMDGPIATVGSIGFRMEMLITGFSHDRPLSDGDKVSVKLVPYAGYANEPASFTIAS